MSDSVSMVEKLSKAANERLNSATGGTGILTSVIILSAILSAIFFWRHSAAVFGGIPVVLATILGLAIGLIPSEGAFFGWKRIRATKKNVTAAQLNASKIGLWAAVGFAVANVIAIFVSSFPGIPEGIQALSAWIVFFALMLPIPTQFILYAWYTVSDQGVVENHNQAKLAALTHAAYIRGEEARIEAAIQGMEAELNRTLPQYAASAGRDNAVHILNTGERNIVGRYYDGVTHNTPPQLTAAPSGGLHMPTAEHLAVEDIIALMANNPDLVQRVMGAFPVVGNSTHTAPRHDAGHAGQGEHERDDNGARRAHFGGEGNF